jgi:hypothetical protein
MHSAEEHGVFLFRFEANQSLIEPGLEGCCVNHCGCGTSPVYNVHTGCSEEGRSIWTVMSACVSYVSVIVQKGSPHCGHNFIDVYTT